MSEIEQSINGFILKEFLPGENPDSLTASTPLITTGIIDSIGALKLVMFLEGQFGVTILPQEINLEHMDTVERIVDLVRSKS